MKGYLDWITEAEDLDPIKMEHNTNSLEVIYITYEDISDSSFLRFVFLRVGVHLSFVRWRMSFIFLQVQPKAETEMQESCQVTSHVLG